MKALLSRFASRRSIGVVIDGSADCNFRGGDHALGRQRGLPTTSRPATASPAGRPRAVAPAVDEADPSQEERSRGRGFNSACPSRRCFRRWCRSPRRTCNASPQSYFLEAVQATNVRAEERIIDLLKLDLNKQPWPAWPPRPAPRSTR